MSNGWIALVDEKLSALVDSASRIPFYRRSWEGVDASAVVNARSFTDTIPILRKQDVLAAQGQEPPFGGLLGVPAEDLRQVNVTGGTSGLGVETYALTGNDARSLGATYARGVLGIGAKPGDRVGFTFPMSLSGASQWIHPGLVAADFHVLPIGAYDTEQKIRLLRTLDADVLIGTPSYVEYLGRQMQAEGLDPRSYLSISKLLVATEAFSPTRVQLIEEMYGARLFEWYGSTQRGMAFTCQKGAISDGERGVLHFPHDEIYVEILDPETGEPLFDPETRDLPPGVGQIEGELVVTYLSSQGSPIVRFGTRDRVYAVPGSRCGCGRPGFGILAGAVGRYDARLKVRGVSIDPANIDTLVFSDPEVREYRVRVTRDAEGRERIQAIFYFIDEADIPAALSRVAAMLKSEIGLTVEVEQAPEPLDSFDDTRRKAKRWADERGD